MAAECLSVARRMSLQADRERMEAMAQRLIELADENEQAAVMLPVSHPTQQPQQQQQSKKE